MLTTVDRFFRQQPGRSVQSIYPRVFRPRKDPSRARCARYEPEAENNGRTGEYPSVTFGVNYLLLPASMNSTRGGTEYSGG